SRSGRRQTRGVERPLRPKDEPGHWASSQQQSSPGSLIRLSTFRARPENSVAEFDLSFDYLELLGVDPAQATLLGIEGLRERIKNKKKEWTSKEINPLYQQEARANKERVRHFERLLLEPAMLVGYLKHIREVRLEKKQRQEEEMRGLVAIATAGERRVISA